MTAPPVVSVIIPAWNAERWIGETLASVTSQSWKLLEVIVVDDGSTDETAKVAEQSSDERVRLIRKPQGGAASARNRGLAESRGDLIQFLDADDLLGDNKLSRQIEALEQAPDGSIASCRWQHFNDGTDGRNAVVEEIPGEPDPIEWLTKSLAGSNMMHPAAWLVPRRVAEAAGPWNERLSLHDDGDYFARVLSHATRNVFVEDAFVFYRTVPESLSRRRSRGAMESALAVCKARHATLLNARDTAQTRAAIATQYAQFAYEFVSAAPDLSRDAVQQIERLGATPHNRIGSSSFRKAVSLLGFSNALKVRARMTSG